jgi:hypothetical protein
VTACVSWVWNEGGRYLFYAHFVVCGFKLLKWNEMKWLTTRDFLFPTKSVLFSDSAPLFFIYMLIGWCCCFRQRGLIRYFVFMRGRQTLGCVVNSDHSVHIHNPLYSLITILNLSIWRLLKKYLIITHTIFKMWNN